VSHLLGPSIHGTCKVNVLYLVFERCSLGNNK
jgi:hypothetical protein